MLSNDFNIDLSGKTAIVTGASRGLGKSIAKELAYYGANIVVVARTFDAGSSEEPGSLQETIDELNEYQAASLAIKADITVDSDLKKVIEQTLECFGHIDVLVNNAGIGMEGDITTFDPDDFDRLLRVNLRAPVIATQLVASTMRHRGSGVIINMSSILADELAEDISNPVVQAAANSSGIGVTGYGLTKAALIRMTKGAAADLAVYGINVNCLKPSWTDTEGLRRWFPDADRSSWSKPHEWGWLTALLSADYGKAISGEIFDESRLRSLRAAAGFSC